MSEAPNRFGRVSSNVAANMIGRAPALLAFLFVPIFVRYLGAEAYGMVGVYYTMTSLITLLDLGVGTATTREVARLNTLDPESVARFVRAVERVYLLMALLIAGGVALASPLIAHHWLNASVLSPSILTRGLVLIGLAIAAQWPFQVYSAAFNGLQEQLTPNLITATSATARPFLLVLAMQVFAPTITVFFAAQFALSLATTAVTAYALRTRVRMRLVKDRWFDLSATRSILRFASRLSLTAALSLAFLNVDKVTVSHFAPLKILGYYTVAFGAASMISLAAQPVFAASFPRFVELLEARMDGALRQQYQLACQAVAVLVIPAGIAGAVFAPVLMHAYIRDANVAGQVQQIFRWLVLANTAAGLGVVPYALQLAFGRTRFAGFQNGVALVLAIPLTIWGVRTWGGVGAAAVLCSLWALSIAIVVPVSHRVLLRGETPRWAMRSILMPASAASAVTFAGNWVVARLHGLLAQTSVAVAFGVLSLAAAAFAAPDVRRWVLQKIALTRA